MKGPRGRTACFGAWFTDAEARTIRRAAGRNGMDPSEWIRKRVLASGGNRAPLPAEVLAESPADLLTAVRVKLGLLEGVVPPMGTDEIRARLAAVIPHDLAAPTPAHDRDRCPDCLSMRVQKLVRRGLGVPVARQLRDAGTMGAAMIAQLELATADQLNEVNAQWARTAKAREALR